MYKIVSLKVNDSYTTYIIFTNVLKPRPITPYFRPIKSSDNHYI